MAIMMEAEQKTCIGVRRYDVINQELIRLHHLLIDLLTAKKFNAKVDIDGRVRLVSDVTARIGIMEGLLVGKVDGDQDD